MQSSPKIVPNFAYRLDKFLPLILVLLLAATAFGLWWRANYVSDIPAAAEDVLLAEDGFGTPLPREQAPLTYTLPPGWALRGVYELTGEQWKCESDSGKCSAHLIGRVDSTAGELQEITLSREPVYFYQESIDFETTQQFTFLGQPVEFTVLNYKFAGYPSANFSGSIEQIPQSYRPASIYGCVSGAFCAAIGPLSYDSVENERQIAEFVQFLIELS